MAPDHFAGGRVERDGLEAGRQIHDALIDERMGVKRAPVADVEGADRLEVADVVPIDQIEVDEPLARVVVVRDEPVGGVGGGGVELGLGRALCRGERRDGDERRHHDERQTAQGHRYLRRLTSSSGRSRDCLSYARLSIRSRGATLAPDGSAGASARARPARGGARRSGRPRRRLAGVPRPHGSGTFIGARSAGRVGRGAERDLEDRGARSRLVVSRDRRRSGLDDDGGRRVATAAVV